MRVKLRKKVISYYEEEIRVGRIVFLAENSSIQHVYSVYRCGTPFDIANKEQYKEILSSKKISNISIKNIILISKINIYSLCERYFLSNINHSLIFKKKPNS